MINNDKQYIDWRARAKSVNWDDLKKVNEMTSQYLRDYPNSAHAQYISAVMDGDYSEVLSPDEEKRVKARTEKTLFSLMERLGDFSRGMQGVLRNEYYYHSNRFVEQYLLGCELLTSGDKSVGNFSIGVGGSEYAFKLLKHGRLAEAEYFAKKAIAAWEDHAAATPHRSYPYPYFYIQALAIGKDGEKARQEFEKIKKKPQYLLKKPIYDKYESRLSEIQRLQKS